MYNKHFEIPRALNPGKLRHKFSPIEKKYILLLLAQQGPFIPI